MIRDHPVEARRGAAFVTAVSLAFVATALIFLAIEIANGWFPLGESGVAQTVIAVAIFAFSFPLVGWIILRRDPSNRLGWIYLAIGFWQALNMFASGYSTLAYWVASGNLPLASELSWVAVWAWVPGFTLFSTLGILLFPTGRLPSRRWWPVVALAAVAFVLLLVPVVALWPYRGLPLELQNALNQPPPSDPVIVAANAIQSVGQVVLLAAMIGSVAGLVIRFRRSTGVERQQLKWFTYAAILDVLLLVVWTVIPLDPLAGALSSLLLAFLPIAIAIAILRYRLYDIDRIVSRTIGYAIVTAILGATFVGIVLLVQTVVVSLLPQVSETGTPAVVASTLAVAALFQPLRQWVQATVDRRFDRARVDRDRSIVRLGNRLRDAVDLDAIRVDVLGTINATIR
ncbi:MAG: hypothetical protein M3067_09420, partial [Chloroflexota bacterium]|nr:hypothetical protein [Chloroflexota bacterium]